MKLTQRDKIMLSVLVIALTLFCGGWFIVRPAFKEVQNSKKEYNTLRSDYQKKQETLQEKEHVVDDLKTMYKECVDLTDNFYDRGRAFEYAQDIYDLLASCGISGTSATITESAKVLTVYSYDFNLIALPLDEYMHTNDLTTGDEVIDINTLANQTVGCYTFTVGFDHMTKENIFEFVEKLRNGDKESSLNKKTLVITDLSFNITEAEEDAGYSGEVKLELYYLGAPDEPEIKE